MIRIDEENVIHITRGDSSTHDKNVIPISYSFKSGDKITFVAMKKKGFTKEEILRKDFTVEQTSNTFNISFNQNDTKKFPLKNKKLTYWYEVRLNDTLTLLGYDEEGAKKLILYPGAEEGL